MDTKLNFYWNLEQRSKEWFELRLGRVGGSEAIGLSTPARLKTIVWLKASEQLTGIVNPDNYKSKDMERGELLEPEARAHFEANYFIDLDVPGYITNKDYPMAGWSPDGIADENKIGFELKCPRAKTHVQIAIENQVPKEYVFQVAQIFNIVPTIDVVYFASYCPEVTAKPMHVVRCERAKWDGPINLWKGQYRLFSAQVKAICDTINGVSDDTE